MFSIIIPLYNKQNSIIETLQSVLVQTFTEFEILVVDDGSTDKSAIRVATINDERIRIIPKVNGGVSSARNKGIAEARFRYLAFLDADDIWEKNYLEEQKRLIEDFSEAKMWGLGWGYIENNVKSNIKHLLIPEFKGYLENYFTVKKKSNVFWTSAVVIDKTIFDKVGVFDEQIRYGEDLDMWYRIVLNYPVVFYNKTLAYYRLDGDNRAMNKEIPLSAFLPYYIEKYAKYRNNSKDFRLFFDKFCLSTLYPYYKENKKNVNIQRVLKQIDLKEQPLSYKFRYKFPCLFSFIVKLKKG